MDTLAVVTRSGYVESAHCGYIAVTDPSGKVLFHIGDPDTKVYFRSCAKPLQVIPLLQSGAAEAFGFSNKEIAIACASHTGQSVHTKTVEQLLNRLGLHEDDLHCGIVDPYDREENSRLIRLGLEPSPLHAACSGKHSAMLALAKFRGCSLSDYEKESNPIQREILETVAEFTDEDPSSIITGMDGCGTPIYLLPIRKIALSYARLVMHSKDPKSSRHHACRTVYDSMTEYPEMVAGEGEFCTDLMRAAGDKLIVKMGAEAVYCLGVKENSLGIAVKIADGNERAVYPVVVSLLKDLKILNARELSKLERWHTAELYNQLKESVGTIRPFFTVGRSKRVPPPIGKNIESLF